MSKYEYFIPESAGSYEAFDAEWLPVEARLKKILPLKDVNGQMVSLQTKLLSIDFSKVAEALTDAPDTAGLTTRFFAAVQKKNDAMTVEQLLSRPNAELTRWRKMGNRIVLLPNALVLHVNSVG